MCFFGGPKGEEAMEDRKETLTQDIAALLARKGVPFFSPWGLAGGCFEGPGARLLLRVEVHLATWRRPGRSFV